MKFQSLWLHPNIII